MEVGQYRVDEEFNDSGQSMRRLSILVPLVGQLAMTCGNSPIPLTEVMRTGIRRWRASLLRLREGSEDVDQSLFQKMMNCPPPIKGLSVPGNMPRHCHAPVCPWCWGRSITINLIESVVYTLRERADDFRPLEIEREGQTIKMARMYAYRWNHQQYWPDASDPWVIRHLLGSMVDQLKSYTKEAGSLGTVMVLIASPTNHPRGAFLHVRGLTVLNGSPVMLQQAFKNVRTVPPTSRGIKACCISLSRYPKKWLDPGSHTCGRRMLLLDSTLASRRLSKTGIFTDRGRPHPSGSDDARL